MQALVYIFIAVIGVAIAATAFLGLTFTPIESLLAGLVAGLGALVVLERILRRRTEKYFDKKINEFSKLLATDAQAGQMLSQRINELSRIDVGDRLDSVESDVSVLGTVVQQVAEAVAEMERQQEQALKQIRTEVTTLLPSYGTNPIPAAAADEDDDNLDGGEMLLTADELRRAIEQNDIILHIHPVVTLPQRRQVSFDVLPRIKLMSGEFVDATDFSPRVGHDGMVAHVESLVWDKAVALARNWIGTGETRILNIPLSTATLSDPDLVERLVATLDKYKGLGRHIGFIIDEKEWRKFTAMHRHGLASLVEFGTPLSVAGLKSLRHDFESFAQNGIKSVRVDAARFVNEPESYSDIHSGDIADYVGRHGIDLVVANVRSEQQILLLIEDNVRFALGNHIAKPGPIPAGFAETQQKSGVPRRVVTRSS